MTIQATIVPPRGRITERELIAASNSVKALRSLRQLQGAIDRNACAQVRIQSPKGSTELPLFDDELEAVVALLIERHSVFLAGLDVELEVLSK